MIMKRVFLLSMCLVLAVSLLYGADFWNKKKYSDWSDKEVQQMLKSSPWARDVELRTGGGSRGGGSTGGGGGRSGRGGGGGGGSMGDASGGMGGGGSAQGSVEMAPGISLVVRWESALPVKQALAKAMLNSSIGMSADAAKILDIKETQYVVSVSGVSQRILRGDTSKMQPVALLNIKGKDPIKAESIKSAREQANAVLYMFFPRTQAIVLEDQEVEVVFKLGPIDLKRKFKLKEMVYQDRLEL